MKQKGKNLTPDELAAEITRLEDEAARRFNSRVQRFAYLVRRSLGAAHFSLPDHKEQRIRTTVRVGLELALASNTYDFGQALEAELQASGFKATRLDNFLFWVTVDLWLADPGTPADAAPEYTINKEAFFRPETSAAPADEAEPLNVSTISPVDPIYSLSRPVPDESERFGLIPPTDAEIEAALTQQMESGIKDILLNTLAADNDADPDYDPLGIVYGQWVNTPLGLEDDPEPDDSTL